MLTSQCSRPLTRRLIEALGDYKLFFMTFSELGAIGEFVSGIAVVMSLVYVGFQIRSNTRSNYALSQREQAQQFTQLSLQIGASIDMRKVLIRINENAIWDDLNSDEQVTAYLVLRAIFNLVNSEFEQFKLGNLAAPNWMQVWWYLESEIISASITKSWWQNSVIPSNSYHPDFRKLVEITMNPKEC